MNHGFLFKQQHSSEYLYLIRIHHLLNEKLETNPLSFIIIPYNNIYIKVVNDVMLNVNDTHSLAINLL